MRFEAEVIANDLLPAVRSIVSEKLHRDYGLTQEEIAARLEITQPAVSQYLSNLRADEDVVEKLREDSQVEVLLDDIASKASKDQDFSAEISQLVNTVRDKGLLKERFEGTKKL